MTESVKKADALELLGHRLRRLRQRAGLNGRQLAEQIGTSQSRVSRTELARFRANLPMVRRWLEVTGADDRESQELQELAEQATLDTGSSHDTEPARRDRLERRETGILDSLGLTLAEESLWQVLVDHPPATVGEISEVVGVSARTVGALLAELEAKGLVIRLAGRPAQYTVTSPDSALDVLVRAREEQLRRVRLLGEQAMHRYRSGRRAVGPEDVVELVRGVEAVRNRCSQIDGGATTEVCSLACPPFLVAMAPELVQPARAGISERNVFDTSALEVPGCLPWLEAKVRVGEQVRLGAVPVKLMLADDRIGMISLQDPPTADAVLVVHPSSLLVALRSLFEAIWAASIPLGGAPGSSDPGAEHRRLLAYLAAGMTDQAIARQLGWHQTTVQRHVRRLMSELGVRTRFQAGRRGWL